MVLRSTMSPGFNPRRVLIRCRGVLVLIPPGNEDVGHPLLRAILGTIMALQTLLEQRKVLWISKEPEQRGASPLY